MDSTLDIPLMAFDCPSSAWARRKRAAALLEAVLDEKIEPCIAINRWPQSDSSFDPSLDCAFQALWHFESDTEKQATEIFYLDAQLELLRQMAHTLQQGESLPAYILQLYGAAPKARFFYDYSLLKESNRLFKKNIEWFFELWHTAWKSIPSHK